MTVVIKLRRDTAERWSNEDPILFEGEIGVEKDTGRFKLGDGIQSWSDLSYFLPEDQLPSGGGGGADGPPGPQGEVGPEGPQGPPGETGSQGISGVRGSKWFSAAGVPTAWSGEIDDDYLLDTDTGDIYAYGGGEWILRTNIKGIQGDAGTEGPQGPQGPAGPDPRAEYPLYAGVTHPGMTAAGTFELGTRFMALVEGCYLTRAAWYKPAAETGSTRTFSLWDEATTTLIDSWESVDESAGPGWVEVIIEESVPLDPNTEYILSVECFTQWASDGLNILGRRNGPVSTRGPENAADYTAFHDGPGSMPDTSASADYYVQPTVEGPAIGGG